MKLKNLNALVTGSSQGLGKAIAEQFLYEGAHVVLCARSENDLTATRDELARRFPHQKVSAKTCDVSNEGQVAELVGFAVAELGSIEALVLNAGVYGPMGPTESVSLDEWRRAVGIGRPTRGLSRQRRKRRHHRQIDQRPMGPVARPAKAS